VKGIIASYIAFLTLLVLLASWASGLFALMLASGIAVAGSVYAFHLGYDDGYDDGVYDGRDDKDWDL
jgi:hypothetical protein